MVATAAVIAAPAQAKRWPAPAANHEVDPIKRLNEFGNRILVQINKARAAAGPAGVRLFQSCIDDQSERWVRKIKRAGNVDHRDTR